MGTNYYIELGGPDPCPNPCAHCSYEVKPLRIHIGKSSAGWRFLHRAYRSADDFHGPEGLDFPVTDRESWLKLLDLGPIVDEYGRAVSRESLIELIESKQRLRASTEYDFSFMKRPDPSFFLSGEYDFCSSEFS